MWRTTALSAQPTTSEPTPAPERPKRSPVVGVVAALAVGALVGGVSGAGVAFWAVSNNTGSPITSSDLPSIVNVNDPDDATLITAVAAKASPSVVTISVSAEAGAAPAPASS